jgi:hypothetical protein
MGPWPCGTGCQGCQDHVQLHGEMLCGILREPAKLSTRDPLAPRTSVSKDRWVGGTKSLRTSDVVEVTFTTFSGVHSQGPPELCRFPSVHTHKPRFASTNPRSLLQKIKAPTGPGLCRLLVQLTLPPIAYSLRASNLKDFSQKNSWRWRSLCCNECGACIPRKFLISRSFVLRGSVVPSIHLLSVSLWTPMSCAIRDSRNLLGQKFQRSIGARQEVASSSGSRNSSG